MSKKFKLTENKRWIISIIIAFILGSGLTINFYCEYDTNQIVNSPNSSIEKTELFEEANIENSTIIVNIMKESPESKEREEYRIELKHRASISCSNCQDIGSIRVDFNNVKINLHSNNISRSVFVNKLMYNQTTLLGYCKSKNLTDCDFLPQYNLDKKDRVCMEINVSVWGEWTTDMQSLEEVKQCLTLHNTNLGTNNFSILSFNEPRGEIQKDCQETIVGINYYKVKILLPDDQFVYFDKVLFDEWTKYDYAICNLELTDCYIVPEYEYDDQEVCIEFILNKDGSMTPKSNENVSNCIQNAETGEFFSEYGIC